MSVSSYAKAIAAFVSTAAAGVVAALVIGPDGNTGITANEWIQIISATLVATLGVLVAPANKPAVEAEPVRTSDY